MSASPAVVETLAEAVYQDACARFRLPPCWGRLSAANREVYLRKARRLLADTGQANNPTRPSEEE